MDNLQFEDGYSRIQKLASDKFQDDRRGSFLIPPAVLRFLAELSGEKSRCLIPYAGQKQSFPWQDGQL